MKYLLGTFWYGCFSITGDFVNGFYEKHIYINTYVQWPLKNATNLLRYNTEIYQLVRLNFHLVLSCGMLKVSLSLVRVCNFEESAFS